MAQTIIADSGIIGDNPLGLATILVVSCMLTNRREAAAIMYTTQTNLLKACYQKTWQLNQVAAKMTGFELTSAEYSFHSQFRVGTRAAREARLTAIWELSIQAPDAVILHEHY